MIVQNGFSQPTPIMDTYDIFQIAREMPEAKRAAYLEEVCHDAEQCEHLERMLADDWFRGVGEDTVAIAEGPGSVIGAYKLLEKIGEGAFGVVFMAEQRGELPRRVALKIIKEGMDTREVIARFEAERRALALMEHSHIAKVFDAGATEEIRVTRFKNSFRRAADRPAHSRPDARK